MKQLNESELHQVSGGAVPLIPVFAGGVVATVAMRYIIDEFTPQARGVLVRNPNSPWSKFRKRK